ncbi:MAG: acetoacetate decarboxylase family protein [Leptolyngbyaceae cyanobacterium]
MRQQDFFQQITQVQVPWGSRKLCFPVFYYDVATLSAQFLAPLKRVKQFLPSSRMHPLRVSPWHCVVSISAFEYRDSDIGSYNEVSIGVPVVVDEPSPLFIGTLRQPPKVLKVYIRHLPVTTEIARDAGVEFAGYPKFLANITFERDGTWVKCHLSHLDQPILTLIGKEGALSPMPRSRIQPITVREGYLLRCEWILSERNQCNGNAFSGGRLELGDHPIAQEMREWPLGQMIAYQYSPGYQAILTPVIESLVV